MDKPAWKYKPIKEGRFSWLQWTMHYLGIVRITYHPVWESWKPHPNPYNPLFWIVMVLFGIIAPFAIPFVSKTENFVSVLEKLKEDLFDRNDWLWKLYETDEEGNWKHLSRNYVLREGTPK